MDVVPVIDVGPLLEDDADPVAVDRVAQEMDRACRDLGFFLITGHGVPDALTARLESVARAFDAPWRTGVAWLVPDRR